MSVELFYQLLWGMLGLGVIVFIALHFVNAGYGIFSGGKWGPMVSNRLGWVVMEMPAFLVMLLMYLGSERMGEPILLTLFLFFELHYFQRSFIFPILMKGNTKMPLSIIFMGIIFNVINALFQGGWLFYLSPEGMYGVEWFYSPAFILGAIIFIVGMIINLQSDYVIRQLRKGPEDTAYYMPQKGMFRYVSSANYFGECVEWLGFALMSFSFSGLVFFLWTFANLGPRARKINRFYQEKFSEEFSRHKPKAIIPKIY